MSAGHRGVLLVLGIAAGFGCGDDGPAAQPSPCEQIAVGTLTAPPAGTPQGEPYRWLARRWESPLGLTIVTYGLAVDGIPVRGQRQIEIYDRHHTLVHRLGSGDAVLAALRAPGRTAKRRRTPHPLAALARAPRPADPLRYTQQRPIWTYAAGELEPAIELERLDLLGAQPVGEVSVRDARTGAELTRGRTIFELAEPTYRVYARSDGRPLLSPLGDTYPHPTGIPDGKVPPFVSQQTLRQRQVAAALEEPWIPPQGTQTTGNNVEVFFNSLLDHNGKLASFIDDQDHFTPEYGPSPALDGGDFLATASNRAFAFAYDPTQTAREYFQDGVEGTAYPPLSSRDVATNAKLVQAFYATNWLHDYFYAAGFDERAGNAQQANVGPEGFACDPLIVHASSGLGTFTFPSSDGTSPVIDLGVNGRSASRRDSSMDFSIVAHEWGHYLIGRLAGIPGEHDALGNLQGLALHEGIADFVGVLVNLDAGDDLRGAFALGSYDNLDYLERRPTLPPAEAAADAAYYGIRRYPYSLELARNPLTFRHLAEPPPLKFYNWKGRGPQLSEAHTAGEIFSEALFQCFGAIVAAHPGADFEGLRRLMAQYLVAGLAAFPDRPSLLDARNAFLTVIRLTSPAVDYPACRAGFAARGLGAGARGPDREFTVEDPAEPYRAADVEESFLDRDLALRLTASEVVLTPGIEHVRVTVRNAGLVPLAAGSVELTPAVPAAARFPAGTHKELEALVPEENGALVFGLVLDACQLPPHPSQAGFRLFDYTVVARVSAEDVGQAVAYHVAIPAPAAPCPAIAAVTPDGAASVAAPGAASGR